MSIDVDAGADTGTQDILDPVAAARARRRRTGLVAGAVVLAAAAAAGATIGVKALVANHHRSVVVNQQPGGAGSQGTTSSILATGAAVKASQLFSDPVFLNPDDGYALASGAGGAADERLVASRNAGATWRVAGSPFPVAGTFTTLLFTDLKRGYVFGPAGLLVTSNGGKRWTQPAITGEVERVIPAYGDVWAVVVRCPGAGVPGQALSCPVTLEISTDQGRTWRQSSSAPPIAEGTAGGAVLGRITEDEAYLLTWGASDSGLVLTVDNGAHWQPVPDPCRSGWSVEDMAALAAGEMWLVCGATPSPSGEVKSVYRSEDGGVRWSLAASTGLAPGAAAPVGHIPFSGLVSQLGTVSPVQAWLGVGGVGLLETNDGGYSWSPVPGITVPPGDTQVGVTFISSPPDGAVRDGWALAFGYGVWSTTDATHWREVARS